MAVASAFKGIGKGLGEAAGKASKQTAKVGTKAGAVAVGGVTVAAVGATAGGYLASQGNKLIDKVSEYSKYIPYIIAGICGLILVIALLKKRR